MRALVLGAVVLGASLVGLWLLDEPAPMTTPAEARPQETDSVSMTASADLSIPAVRSLEEGSSRDAAVAGELDVAGDHDPGRFGVLLPPEGPAPVEVSEWMQLTGTLRLLDPADLSFVRLAGNGSFTLDALLTRGRSRRFEIGFAEGKWSSRIPRCGDLRIIDVREGSEPLLFAVNRESRASFVVPPSGPLHVDLLFPRTVTVQGTLSLVDAGSGEPLPPCREGTMTLAASVREDADHRGVSVEIRNGRWSAELMPGKYLHASGVVVDGRDALAWPSLKSSGGHAPILFPVDDVGEFTVALPSVSLVHVLDESGEPVSGISLKSAGNPFHTYHERLVLSGASSPIDLAALDLRTTGSLWVRSSGYAWGEIAAPSPLGGEQVVRLSPAGDLEVHVSGLEEYAGVVTLELRRPSSSRSSGRRVFEDRVATSSRIYESLPAGEYVLSVPSPSGQLYAADLHVVAGQRVVHRIALEGAKPETPEHAELAGTISISPDWGEFHLRLLKYGKPARRVQPTSLARVEGSPRLWTWSAGSQPVVHFLATVESSCSVSALVVPGSNDNHIEVPDPARVVLTLRTPGGRTVTDLEGFGWRAHNTASDSRASGAPILEGEHFEFTAPACDLLLNHIDPRYAPWGGRVYSLSTGDNRLDVEVRPSFGFAVTLQSESGVIVPRRLDSPRVTDERGEELPWQFAAMGMRIEGNRWIVDVPKPGPYRLDFGGRSPDGYSFPEPIVAVAREGERVDVTLHLERDF